MITKLLVLCLLLVIGVVGCASGPKIDTGIGQHPTSQFGWNVGAGDLMDPARAACRLDTYLSELAEKGYAKRIRMVYTPSTGPFQLQYWIPVIREKKYRVFPILSQDGRGGKYGDDSSIPVQAEWILNGLVPIKDILDGVQPSNEPDGFSGKTPQQFADWYRAMVAMIRVAVPGVPIVSPDLRGVGEWNKWVKETGLKYGVDYDVISLHVTHQNQESELKEFIRDAHAFAGVLQPKTWVTEGDWGQGPWLSAHGLPIEQVYIYVYNCNMGGYGPNCEPETRRIGGGLVPACEVQ